MFTKLYTISRLAVLAFVLLSLAALTAEQLHSERVSNHMVRENPWETLVLESGDGRGTIHLIDRVSGQTKIVGTSLPERWDFLAASPFMAEDESMQAVGRYSSPLASDGTSTDASVGLVRVNLPRGEVLERVEMEVMPTGRPAWDPNGASHLIFPGATGQLYSYRFSDDASKASTISPVQWRCEPPGDVEPFIIDPVWPKGTPFRNLVIVSLSPARRLGFPGEDPPLAPWWLELDEDSEAIIAAGPLFDADGPKMARVRYPNLAWRDGRPELIYVQHDSETATATVCTAELEFGKGPNRLRVRPGTAGPASDAPLTFGAMLPTLDARLAFSVPPLGRHAVMVSLNPRPRDEATQ